MNTVRFINKDRSAFFQTLRGRVDSYFRENKIRKEGNYKMVIKTIAMLAIYITPFVLILTLGLPLWANLLLYLVMGLGAAGIGLSVMHDANHGAYSHIPWVNKMMSLTMNLVGGSAFLWRLQHNVLHHTYTNVHGMDEDLDAGRIMRFSVHVERKPIHKYQHIYALPLYSLLTLVWTMYSDYPRMVRYIKKGLVHRANANPTWSFVKLIFSKIFYAGYMIALPLLVTNMAWWQVLLGFLIAQFTAGFILSLIFQMAHVMESTHQPMADENGVIENDWAIHQLNTTANFGNENKLLSWYAGGLNFQIEHHLFPSICHIHYKKLSKIVRDTAKEFDIPYLSYSTFGDAIKAHVRHLKHMGQNDSFEPTYS